MGVEKASCRDEFGKSLLKLCSAYSNIYIVNADTSRSTRTFKIGENCPDQFVEVGISEQNLLGVSAGLALTGKKVFVSTFSSYIVGRSLDILKSVIALQNLDVVIVGTHSGLSGGELGWSHHICNDLSVFLSLPNFYVMVPADVVETRKMVNFLARLKGPAYLRLGRDAVPKSLSSLEDFDLKMTRFLRKGKQVLLVTYGSIAHNCIEAADILNIRGISCAVLEVHTLKPLDRSKIIEAVKDFPIVLVIEEHHVHGGLGSLIAPLLVGCSISIFDIISIPDLAFRSFPYEYLLKECGLDVEHIVDRVEKYFKVYTK